MVAQGHIVIQVYSIPQRQAGGQSGSHRVRVLLLGRVINKCRDIAEESEGYSARIYLSREVEVHGSVRFCLRQPIFSYSHLFLGFLLGRLEWRLVSEGAEEVRFRNLKGGNLYI